MMAERPREIELGRWWARSPALRFKQDAVRRYPAHTLEVREVPQPDSYSKRPVYAVVLVFQKPLTVHQDPGHPPV